MREQTVYLAGGFKSNWANDVRESLEGYPIRFIDPKTKEFKNGERVTMDVNEYGKWDLHFIRQSDIVFVFVERDNPSCIGLACEAGYAKGLGKTVITVLKKGNLHTEDRYLSFITQVSDITFENFSDGVDYLKSFCL